MHAFSASILCVALAACVAQSSVVLLAFPHGGDAGADGIRADFAATVALRSREIEVGHLDLNPGVQNPHQDEETDDERAVAQAARLPISSPVGATSPASS